MPRLTGWLLAAALIVLASIGAAHAWGAIAADDEAGQEPDDVGFAWVGGYTTREEAATDALAECRNEGNDDCRLMLTFQGCGAYAASTRSYAVGQGATLLQAEQRARAKCPSCRIIVSDCE